MTEEINVTQVSKPRYRDIRWRVWGGALLLLPVLLASTSFLPLDLPIGPTASMPSEMVWVACAHVSLSISLLLGALWSHKHRLRAVLRPTNGKVVAAVFLTAFTPIGSFFWIPIAYIWAFFAGPYFWRLAPVLFFFWYVVFHVFAAIFEDHAARGFWGLHFWITFYFAVALVSGIGTI